MRRRTTDNRTYDADRMSKLERDYEDLKRCLAGAVAVDSGGYFDTRNHESLMRRVRLPNAMLNSTTNFYPFLCQSFLSLSIAKCTL